MADEDDGDASLREGKSLHAEAPERRHAVSEEPEGSTPEPDPHAGLPVRTELATPRGHPGEGLQRPPAEAVETVTVEPGRDGLDPQALVEGIRTPFARAGSVTRGALGRAERLAERALSRMRDGTGDDGIREATLPPVPPMDSERGPRTPVLDAHRARDGEADTDAAREGFRLLAVGPASPDEEPPAPPTSEPAPIQAPEPGHDAPPVRPGLRGDRVPADVEAGPPVRAPSAPGAAPPAAPPTVDEETTVPVSEEDDDADQGLIASLRERLSGDDEPEEPDEGDQAPEEELEEEPEPDQPGLFARLRDRFGGDGQPAAEVESAEETDESEEEIEEPPSETPEPEALEHEEPPSPSADRARPDEAGRAPQPPERGDPVPARPAPSSEPGAAREDRPTPEREPSPAQARRGTPATSPTPAPPPGESTLPSRPAGTPTLAAREAIAEEEADEDEPHEEAPEPEAEEELAAEASAPEEPDEPDEDADDGLHDRIDEVLDRHERQPGLVLSGRSSSR